MEAKRTQKEADKKTHETEPLNLFEEGACLVSLTFGLALYTDAIFTEIPGSVLKCYEAFLRLCSKDNLRFYATENMRQHKPITSRTFGMLQTWLKPGAPPKDFIYLELKDGKTYKEAPTFKFTVSGYSRTSPHYQRRHCANAISIAFPKEWGIERSKEMLDFTRELCSILPFQSGHAGFSYECSPYAQEQSRNFAWTMSMRHRGIDISRLLHDKDAVGHDAVKGVSWLTMICSAFVERLGGLSVIRNSLSREMEIIDTGGGILLKAGALPAIGDVNRRDLLPLYRQAYRVIAPLVAIAAERSPYLISPEKTEAWFRRFAGE